MIYNTSHILHQSKACGMTLAPGMEGFLAYEGGRARLGEDRD